MTKIDRALSLIWQEKTADSIYWQGILQQRRRLSAADTLPPIPDKSPPYRKNWHRPIWETWALTFFDRLEKDNVTWWHLKEKEEDGDE